MRVGILGSGLMGGKARAGTPREAAQNADAVLLAVHWLQFDDVLGQAGDLSGKTVITCSLPMNAENTTLVVGFDPVDAGPELAYRFDRIKE